MSNTLIDIRQRLQQGSVAQGWGAILVLSRSRLNRLLEQEFIASFSNHSYLPLISGEVALDEAGNDTARLHEVQLGAPQLLFSSASLTDSRAQLRLPVIAGQITVEHASPAAARTVSRSFDISQAQGYWLQVDIDLKLVQGRVDQLGVVAVDLSSASQFHCNLAGDDAEASQRLGALFQRGLQQLRSDQGLFRLGVLDLKHYGLLAPKTFRILTQAAPGARVAGALNWGDGAVVVLIRLQGNGDDEGTFPPASNFPYLIPSDQDGSGQDKFSATLLLGQPMRQFLQGDTPPLFSKLRFTGGAQYRPLEQERRHDLVSFGQIDAPIGNLQLQPAYAQVLAGHSLDLRLTGGTASAWQVTSLEGRNAEAHGSINNGRYTAPLASAMGHGSINVVVTATVGTGAAQRSVSALLLVVFDSMAVAPRVLEVPYQAGEAGQAQRSAAPIRLSAFSLNRAVDWSLRGEPLGELASSGANEALFVPNANLGRRSIEAQRIEATGDQTQPASLLLTSGQQLLGVEPCLASAVRRASRVSLHDDRSLLPGLARHWQVIGGAGEVDEQGVFSAPDDATTADSVVLCEIIHNDVVFSSGYSVIQCSERSEPERWKELQSFTVKVPGFGNADSGALFGNGYQQLQVQIEVKTTLVDNKYIGLSQREVDSLRLRERRSAQDVQPLEDPGGDPDNAPLGMDENDRVLWRTNDHENGFEKAAATQPLPASEAGLLADSSARTLYLHSRVTSNQVVEFTAVFKQDDTDRWFESDDNSETSGVIKITGKPQPAFTEGHYQFERTRVLGNEPPEPEQDNDKFDYHLRTIDYWVLRANAQIGADFRFQTLRFVDENGADDARKVRRSMIRWESEALNEEMFSWTGWAFHSAIKRGEDSGSKLRFDEDLGKLVHQGSGSNDERNLDIDVAQGYPADGTLVISLHRTDRVDYVAPNSSSARQPDKSPIRDRLTGSVYVVLRDQRGNLHKRRISFLEQGAAPGSRNRLQQQDAPNVAV